MESRIAIIGIFVYSPEAVASLNALLSDYNAYIVGRMGIPYKQRGISVISIIADAPNDIIAALSGKLGMLPDVSVKTIYSKQ